MRKLIIYDENCPMCRVYTKGMVAVDNSGNTHRIGSNHLTDPTIISRLDPQRARHELPMVDLDGGETLYGVDTWAWAFGRQNEGVRRLLSLNYLRTILQAVYAFISYNRRIIVPQQPGRWDLFDLTPDFRPGYRLAFAALVLVLTVTAVVHTAAIGYVDGPFFAFLIGQLLVVGLYACIRRSANWQESFLDYAAHLGLCFLIGGLPKLIGIVTGAEWLLPVGNALIVGQHFIRGYSLQLSPWLSVLFAAGLLLTV